MTGMRITFAVAAILIVVTLAIAIGTYCRTLRNRTLAPGNGELIRIS